MPRTSIASPNFTMLKPPETSPGCSTVRRATAFCNRRIASGRWWVPLGCHLTIRDRRVSSPLSETLALSFKSAHETLISGKTLED